MDPTTLILTALATGVAEGVSSEIVKTTYQGLRTLIANKLSKRPEAEMIINKFEEKPEVWETPLKDALTETDADRDEKIIRTAQELMKLVNPKQAAAGKYNVQFTEKVQGVVLGDDAQVTMIFGDEPQEKE